MSNDKMSRPKPKGQLLTIAIILIMGPIMIVAGLLQTPYIIIAVMFGFALMALGIGALYFYNKDKKKDQGGTV